MSYIHLKTLLYWAVTAFGVFLIACALITGNSNDPVQQGSAWAMILIGSGVVTFGVLTFILKDDPDIWR
jgi:hypothetical protein